MKLYTECHWDGWDRIVDIYPERCDALPEYINDDTTYKVIVLEKGSLEISDSGKKNEVKAPALIGLTQKDKPSFKILQNIKGPSAKQFCFGTGNKHPRVYPEKAAKERRFTQEILKGDPFQTFADQVFICGYDSRIHI